LKFKIYKTLIIENELIKAGLILLMLQGIICYPAAVQNSAIINN